MESCSCSGKKVRAEDSVGFRCRHIIADPPAPDQKYTQPDDRRLFESRRFARHARIISPEQDGMIKPMSWCQFLSMLKRNDVLCFLVEITVDVHLSIVQTRGNV